MCVAEVRNGTKTVGAFVLVNLIMLQLYQPLNFMGMVYRDIRQAIIDVEAMFVILAQDPEIEDIPGAQPLKVTAGAVRFENVNFAYDPGRPILRGVSFEAPAGHTIAIVGPSGAGKSTISRLLFRFYEPNAGRILIDGQNIAAVTQSSLRAAIGMVPQDTVLFNDTILYNIHYGRDGASEAEVIGAAEDAQIDQFIRSLPRATMRRSASGASSSPAARSSGWPSHAQCSRRRRFWCSTKRHRRSIASPSAKFSRRWSASPAGARQLDCTSPVDRGQRRRDLVLDKGVLPSAGPIRSFWRGAESIPRCGAAKGRSTRRRNCCGKRAVRTISAPPTVSWLSPRRDIGSDWRHECARFVSERGLMSIVKSLRGQLAPIHPEGYMFVPGFAVATLILWWLWSRLGWLGLITTLWCAYFFRDPARVTPVRSDLVIAPADGVVSFAGFAAPPPELGLGMAPLQRVSIFMSVFDCHVNRAPVQGRVAQIVYHPGLFLSADLDKASQDNERNSLVIDAPSGRFGVVQIAGLVARRIVCFTHEGALVGAGERIGLIRFGSRVDVYLPSGAQIVVGQFARHRRRDGDRAGRGRGRAAALSAELRRERGGPPDPGAER